MSPMKKHETIVETLRRCAAESGRTQRDLAAEAGISHIVLNRFLRQGRGLSMAGIDSLGRILGLQLVPTPTTTKTATRRKRK
jgi:transcriptional regulator with XRE-family HTH domain